MSAHGEEDSRPAFARRPACSEGTTELRGECPRWVVAVLDAVAMARGGQSAGVHRATVMVEELTIWAEKKLHEASLIHRVAGFNPTDSDTSRSEVSHD